MCLLVLAACGIAPEEPDVRVSGAPAALGVADVKARDLAIAFALNGDYLVAAEDRLVGGSRLLPESWYGDIEAAFDGTSAEDALRWENWYEDWKLVTARMVPCSPLGATVAADNDELCWPEARLVFQPILYNVRIHARFSPAFADDRAVHALYDVPPEAVLPGAQAQRARTFMAAVRDGQSLSFSQRAEFAGLRDAATRAFMSDVLALRAPTASSDDYDGFGLRPEMLLGGADERGLRDRMLALLSRYTPPQRLRELTAFSLPAGREPAHLDEWVFVAFRGDNGSLEAQDIKLTNHATGATLFNYGKSMTASQGSDDARIYAALTPAIEASVILDIGDIDRLRGVVADRRQRLVPHTSCASCHKLNGLRFDFHNFGYLEDRELTVAPRVRRDVELDLAWLATHGCQGGGCEVPSPPPGGDGDGDSDEPDVDADNDGHASDVDCDDNDASRFPGAPERCDGVDNNCDGAADEVFTELGDACDVGVGACARAGALVCTADGGGVSCDVTAGAPASSDICGNGIDDDCDGDTDEGCAATDADGDGADVGDDCNDVDPRVFPGQAAWFDAPSSSGFDFDCDGVEQPRWTSGWSGSTPDCGEQGYTGSWWWRRARVQECR